MEENKQTLQVRSNFLRNLKCEAKNGRILEQNNDLDQNFDVLQPSHEGYVKQKLTLKNDKELNNFAMPSVKNTQCDMMCHENLLLPGDETLDAAMMFSKREAKLHPSHNSKDAGYVSQELTVRQESLHDKEFNNNAKLIEINPPFDLMCHEEMPLSENETADAAMVNSKNETSLDPFYDSDNSKDADYVPEVDKNSDNSVDFICVTPTKKITILSNILFKPKKTLLQPTTNTGPLLNSNELDANSNTVNHCEYNECRGEVFSSCGYCECYLCWEHFNDDVAYKNCKMHKTYKSHESLARDAGVKTKKYVSHESLPKHVPAKSIAYCQNVTDGDGQHCEFINCTNKVSCTCSACFCLLCLDHFTFNELECTHHRAYATDETIGKKKTKKSRFQKHKLDAKSSVTESFALCNPEFSSEMLTNVNVQHCEFIDCTVKAYSTCTTCFCLLCLDHFMNTESKCSEHRPYTTTLITGPVLTMKGTLRKRKLYDEDLNVRKYKKAKIQGEKMSLKPPCHEECKKKCSSTFSQTEREKIHGEYNKLDWTSQGVYIKGLVDVKPVNRRKQNAAIKKNITYVYNFYKENDGKKEVCKTFFLSTLGYDAKNDTRVLAAISKPMEQQNNLRGKYERKNKIDREKIKAHIIKYDPSISHYRREHAPNRLYLPSDIKISTMFDDFCLNNPNEKISLEVYRRIVRHDLNISFAHLGHEECETCETFKEHDKTHFQIPIQSCEVCQKFETHKLRYTNCRKEYQKDAQTSKSSSGDASETIFYSVDLQKVIMLPRIDQFKVAVFCPRIITFNESFVPLGPSGASKIPFAAIWPESISGRNKEDIISAFKAFLLHKRDVKHIILWLDNCAAQNKNWAMFSFLVNIINSDEISAETITLKYLEPGHTFMSADSFHHQVELSLKRKKIYDYDDFAKAVQEANSKKCDVKQMQVNDFYNYQDYASQARLNKREPRCYLKDIMSVKAERGQFILKYKTCHTGAEHQLDFLMAKILKKKSFPKPSQKSAPRGIEESRKKQILEKLVPLMPENRRTFWYNLPSNSS